MVDVVGNDSATSGDFGAHEFDVAVLAQGDVLHFLSDDALARIVHLGDVLARFGAQGFAPGALPCERGLTATDSGTSVVFKFAAATSVGFGIATFSNPAAAQSIQADGGLTFRAHGAVDAERLILGSVGGVVQFDLGHGDSHVTVSDLDGVVLWMIFCAHESVLSSFAGANQTGSTVGAVLPLSRWSDLLTVLAPVFRYPFSVGMQSTYLHVGIRVGGDGEPAMNHHERVQSALSGAFSFVQGGVLDHQFLIGSHLQVSISGPPVWWPRKVVGSL